MKELNRGSGGNKSAVTRKVVGSHAQPDEQPQLNKPKNFQMRKPKKKSDPYTNVLINNHSANKDSGFLPFNVTCSIASFSGLVASLIKIIIPNNAHNK